MKDNKKDTTEDQSNQERDEAPVEGTNFLSHLRAAGSFDRTNQEDPKEKKADETKSAGEDEEESPLLPAPSTPLPAFQPRQGIPVSALKSPKSPESPKQQHKRGVSWGLNTTTDFIADNTNKSRRKLTLEDITRTTGGLFAEEAEANILRSIEQQDSQSPEDDSADAGIATGLLPEVPDDAAHDFTSAPELPLPRANLMEQQRQNRSRSSASNENEDDQERLPLVNSAPRRQLHRRNMTIEDTLAGLTDAMSAIHVSQRRLNVHQQDGRHRPSTPSTATSSFDNDDNAELSAGHAFADTALRLHHSPKRDGNKPRAMWELLAHNLSTLREEEAAGSGAETANSDSKSNDSEQLREGGDIEAQGGVQASSRVDNGASKQSIGHKKKGRRMSATGVGAAVHGATDKFKDDLEVWRSFFRPRRETVAKYIKSVLFYVLVPLLGVSVCLYYFAGNPNEGYSETGEPGDKPSVSWWLIFIVRQVITFSMALTMQAFVIDFLALGSKVMIKLVGPVITLLIVQAKGWPFIVIFWGIFDFAMLHGNRAFSHHWLYWQDVIDVFNSSNPSGHVVDSPINTLVLEIAVAISAVVTVKRFVIGLYLGRQTFNHYGHELAKTMNKMLLVSEVAALAKDIEKAQMLTKKDVSVLAVSSESGDQIRGIAAAATEDEDDQTEYSQVDDGRERVVQMENRDPLTGSLHVEEKAKLMQLLGRWEDPERSYGRNNRESSTISAVLRFRRALTLIHKSFPFSIAFGLADSREACIDSAQHVYDRLLKRSPGQPLVQFETLALIAIMDDEKTIDQRKAKDLVKVFRPDRQGNLSMLDFVKSVDSVYKEYRLLMASIDNSSQIDRAFENILNVVFYAIVITITMSVLGIDPLGLFLSFSSIILAFAFMIGSASAKYFEGLLFILVRRPYNIGDRIHVSNIEQDTSFDGAPGWTVEHVTLFETIATWLPTNEKCSLSNGSLASSRIINWARSTQAQFHLFLKLPIDTPYERIVVLKNAIEEYMKARPREWLAFNGFRANRIETEKAVIEYIIVIQHRDAWQNIGQVLDSKANISSYILEVTQQLGMEYKAPQLRVDMKDRGGAAGGSDKTSNGGEEEEPFDADARMENIRKLTHNHNIRLN